MRAGKMRPAEENVTTDEVMSTRDVAKQREGETGGGEGSVVPRGSRLGNGGEERQATLPLVLVPFEPIT